MTRRMQVGKNAEALAVAELERRGYRLVATNWHCQAGELDAVMLDGEEVVFVEVKARSGTTHGTAEEALSPSKSRKLAIAAEWYLTEHPGLGDPIWRIDLIAIRLDPDGTVRSFTHIANAAVSG